MVNSIKGFLQKIKPSRSENTRKSKDAKKSLLNSLKDVGKEYPDDNTKNMLKKDIERVYGGLKKAAIDSRGLHEKKFENSSSERSEWNSVAFDSGLSMESDIETKIKDVKEMSENFIKRIDNMIKNITSGKNVPECDFMKDKKVIKELERVKKVFESYKNTPISNEEKRLKGELTKISTPFQQVASARENELKKALSNLLKHFRSMTFLTKKNLKEFKINKEDPIIKYVKRAIKSSEYSSEVEYLENVYNGFAYLMKMKYCNPDLLYFKEFIEPSIFNAIRDTLKNKIEKIKKKDKEKNND